MNTIELASYIQENSQVKDLFLERTCNYLNDKNRARSGKSKWSEARIEKQADQMFDRLVTNVYEKVAPQIKVRFRNNADSWVHFMQEHEIIAQLEELVSELEFE
ncbi:hypothetical protein [uncultured Secundilactobacillus sp.]|uniref:hypothetical protein n=1 Tax=uncultured Secundilactobacillus sp. TaxID=2813935 RepID=UPI00258494EC|nr:hypothetical protein [uncultured Secundilactobacillus sp.]